MSTKLSYDIHARLHKTAPMNATPSPSQKYWWDHSLTGRSTSYAPAGHEQNQIPNNCKPQHQEEWTVCENVWKNIHALTEEQRVWWNVCYNSDLQWYFLMDTIMLVQSSLMLEQ